MAAASKPVYLISSLPALSSHSRATLPANWQEDELGNLQQLGAGWRPTTPTAVPPEGDAAAGARWGGAASGLQAGGNSQGSPCCLPGFACRLRYGGAKDHASQRSGDPSLIGFPYNNEYVSGLNMDLEGLPTHFDLFHSKRRAWMSSNWWSETHLRMLLRYKTAISNRETPSKLWVRFFLWKLTSEETAKCSQENSRSGRKTTVSVCWSDLRAGSDNPPASALVKVNNSAFSLRGQHEAAVKPNAGVNKGDKWAERRPHSAGKGHLQFLWGHLIPATSPWPPWQLPWLNTTVFLFDLL